MLWRMGELIHLFFTPFFFYFHVSIPFFLNNRTRSLCATHEQMPRTKIAATHAAWQFSHFALSDIQTMAVNNWLITKQGALYSFVYVHTLTLSHIAKASQCVQPQLTHQLFSSDMAKNKISTGDQLIYLTIYRGNRELQFFEIKTIKIFFVHNIRVYFHLYIFFYVIYKDKVEQKCIKQTSSESFKYLLKCLQAQKKIFIWGVSSSG